MGGQVNQGFIPESANFDLGMATRYVYKRNQALMYVNFCKHKKAREVPGILLVIVVLNLMKYAGRAPRCSAAVTPCVHQISGMARVVLDSLI